MRVPGNALSSVKNVIAVVSGKGGVGKSLVTGLLASRMQASGAHAAVMDADLTGPTIPRLFGLNERMLGSDEGLEPARSATGVDIVSMNLILENATDPVIWRGSVIANVVRQFWTDVVWGDLDYLFVDCPPGTGDVPLTVFQSLPLDGVVIVSSPQDLVSMIVQKAAHMADMMKVPVLGLVENMSYVICPDCGKEIRVFGDSHIDEIAEKFGYDLLGKIPMDYKLAALVDKGWIEMMENSYLEAAADAIERKCPVSQDEE